MRREDFSFNSEDGLEIAYYRWRAPARALGIVQIAHGMGEHTLRYAHVAEFLNQAGFHVYSNDHRGHGQSVKSRESLGDFGAGGWNALVADMATLTRLARTREGGLPVILLGHSMGSFAAQQYVIDHSALIAGLVLSGSAAINKQAMATMVASAMRLVDPAELAKIRKDLPIYIFAGDKDPLNHGLEFITPLAERYRAAGIANVSEKYYPDGRHEMLNETNRDEVMRDLLSWIQKTIAK